MTETWPCMLLSGMNSITSTPRRLGGQYNPLDRNLDRNVSHSRLACSLSPLWYLRRHRRRNWYLQRWRRKSRSSVRLPGLYFDIRAVRAFRAYSNSHWAVCAIEGLRPAARCGGGQRRAVLPASRSLYYPLAGHPRRGVAKRHKRGS